jgi:hypothetical protein
MNIRLDASESAWLNQQLEKIDSRLYEIKFPALKARQFIPSMEDVPEWARVYSWDMTEQFGSAKIISNMADDLPQVNVNASRTSRIIKPVGASYSYDLFEIKASKSSGVNLDFLKAKACRYAVDRKIDDLLAFGDANYGLEGLLNLSDVASFTLSTKAATGLTWAVATGEEIANDLMGIANARAAASRGLYDQFHVLLPIAQYQLAATRRIGSNSDTTALQFALANCPHLAGVDSWYHLDGAGAGGLDRMVCYSKTPEIVAGIVPQEFMTLEAEKKNLTYEVAGLATCGGVVSRYPVAISYADGL